MGVGINSALALLGTAGVGSNKIGTAISESNDGERNELMAQKAKLNAERLKAQKLKNKKLRLQNRDIQRNTLKKAGD